MTPFLKSIAKAYSSRYEDLSEICFVFPNKRSGTFFLKYLKEEVGTRPHLAPEVMTITDFVGMLSGKVVASRLDSIFTLYDAYREVKGLHVAADGENIAEDFDSFRGWGETVLSDFSEVDQYMVPQDEIYKNVKDFREISSNFLTDEQRQIMAEYFGHSDYGNPTEFWKNFDDEENMSELKGKFLRLWQILFPLYETFTSRLESKGLATNGRIYRLAAETLREGGRDVLPYKKVVMVGFNALSASEHAIFAELRDAEGYEGLDSFGDFFWDATGPVLTGGDNSASKFVRANIRRFPAPEWALPYLRESDSREMPRLRVVASPSKSAQAKIAGSLLEEQKKRLADREITDAKVAVVLPDEGMLLPMLYSLPDKMGDINLTMGYSLRLTSVVSFVSLLRMIGGRVRKSGDAVAFYHKDLRLFLGHPFTHALLGRDIIGKIISFLDTHHRAIITISELRGFSEGLASLLDMKDLNDNPSTTLRYVRDVLAKVVNSLSGDNEAMSNTSLDIDHINTYMDALQRLEDILREYTLRMHPATVMRLIDRLIAGERVGFEGEPLSGLQVMGTLETRSVDFEYLTILSMNERVMPRRARTRSFIPDSLRRAYGMPPSTYSESIFAYYFFRMISRAKEVTMIYDARTGGGTGGGDISRYILQLKHLYAKDMIERQDWKFRLCGKRDGGLSIEKTPEILSLLNNYTLENGANFSASSLSAYRECEAKFFYKHVLGIDTDREPSEYIDAIMFGNIVHEVMQNLYVPQQYHGKFLKYPLNFDRKTLQNIYSNTDLLWLQMTRATNRLHFRLPSDDLDRPLTGGAEMVGRQIMQQVRRVIRYDMSVAPFKILGCEIKETLRIPLPSGRTVNFKFAIDRLDEVMGEDCKLHRRIVDYKTGKLKQTAEDWDSVFTGDYKSEQLFQLFTYAWLLGMSSGSNGNDDVMLEIYHIPGMMKNVKRELPTIGEDKVTTYLPYAENFSNGMERMLDSVFEKKQFEVATDESRCVYCALKSLCRR